MRVSKTGSAFTIAGCLLLSIWGRNAPASIQFQETTTVSGLERTGPGFGASWGYFNDDEWPDLWVGNHASPPDLFINNKNGTFSATPLNLATPRADMHGAAWADFDNDGDQDLVILVGANFGTGQGPNQLLVNADGQLDDKAAGFGLDYPLGRGRTPLWLDWNADGLLDILISNEARADGQAPTALFSRTVNSFTDSSPDTGLTTSSGAAFAQLIYLGNSNPAIIVEGNPFPNRVYSTQNSPFVDVNNGSALFPNNLYGVSDATIADFDGDQRSDVFVSTSQVYSGVLLENGEALARIIATGDEKGFSTPVTGDTLQVSLASTSPLAATDVYLGNQGIHPASLNFTLSSQDIDTAGIAPHSPGISTGIYVGYDSDTGLWNFLVSGSGRFRADFTVGAENAIITASPINFDPTDAELQDHIFLQSAGGGFNDYTVAAGLDTPTQCESVAAGDFDNDMDIDIYMVCQRPLVNQPNLLFENDGDAHFTKVANAAGARGTSLGRGDSVATADYDNDGFLDLFITNSSDTWPPEYGPSQLFRNAGNANHWLEIDLEGTVSNRDAVGARVLLTTGNITQLRVQNGGVHYKTQNHQRIHFGLGGNTLVDKLEIDWPSGIKQVLRALSADQIVKISERDIDNSAPAISGMPSILHTQSTAYSFIPQFSDPDGDTPLFSITNKPPWADFDTTTGELSGIPGNENVGITNDIVISVDDQQAQANSVAKLPAFNLEVLNVNDTPVATEPIIQPPITEGVGFGPLATAAHFNDPDGDPLAFSIAGLPPGSGISLSSEGIISGVPTHDDAAVSPLNLFVTATDPSSASATLAFELFVFADSNGDGISDQMALSFGLDPNDPDADTDNDGIADAVEIGSDLNSASDLDGDGRIDALEPGNSARDASIIDSLPLPDGGTGNIATAPGESLSNVRVSEATDPPAGVAFPFGLLSYTTSAPVGGSVAVRLTFTADLPSNLVIYKVDNAGVYAELPTDIWRKIDTRSVEIALTDGNPLTDQDGMANGSINDPIALADVGNVTTVSTGGGGGGCTMLGRNPADPVFLIIILASLIFTVRNFALGRRK